MDQATAALRGSGVEPTQLTHLEGPRHRAAGALASDAAPQPRTERRADVVVCSFHTDDAYYRDHAHALRTALERLGIPLVLEEVTKGEGQDWADICRKKVAFLAAVCELHPDARVFWIDVDCSLTELPDYVASFSADIIGFQRGFGTPLSIGYARRTRFWEPCFFGINATPAARAFVADAARLERSAAIKATDDYFFEESWRANAPALSFQVIPSAAVLGKAVESSAGRVRPFFRFGASGSVAEFKDKVVQHDAVGGQPLAHRVRRVALRGAKAVERSLPRPAARSLRRLADGAGLTHALVGGDSGDGGAIGSPQRTRAVAQMLAAGQEGDRSRIEQVFDGLSATSLVSPAESAAKDVADSFATYATGEPGREPVRLAWWPRPYPGNFGDWLSPLVVGELSGRPVRYRSLTSPATEPHIVAVGSVGRFVRPGSIVVGTGISTEDLELDASARYVSVRGPVTARVLRRSGGPTVETTGDPGILLSRLRPFERQATNGRVALVRHFKHAPLPVVLPENWDEIGVLASSPAQISALAARLCRYDAVVTSAMHVMIACHSYGIPFALVTFEGLEDAVHGTGVKYRDYCLGAGLDTVYEPVAVSADLRRLSLDALLSREKVSEEKLDEVELAVTVAVGEYLDRIA